MSKKFKIKVLKPFVTIITFKVSLLEDVPVIIDEFEELPAKGCWRAAESNGFGLQVPGVAFGSSATLLGSRHSHFLPGTNSGGPSSTKEFWSLVAVAPSDEFSPPLKFELFSVDDPKNK